MVRDRKLQFLISGGAMLARVLGGLVLAAALLVAALSQPAQAQAERIGRSSGHPLPRFASLKADEVNFRRGPGMGYAIAWILRRRQLPVKVIGEYDNWRRVELHTGERGWVHRALLSTRRFATPLAGGAELYDAPMASAKSVARLGVTAPLRLKRCNREWCEVEISVADRQRPFGGWALKRSLWGVEGDDIFN